MVIRIVRICIGRGHIAADYIKNVKHCIVNISALKNTRGNLVTSFPVKKSTILQGVNLTNIATWNSVGKIND